MKEKASGVDLQSPFKSLAPLALSLQQYVEALFPRGLQVERKWLLPAAVPPMRLVGRHRLAQV